MRLRFGRSKRPRPAPSPYKLADSDGLYLLVAPSGAGCWRMSHHHLGKRKTLAFGAWPDTGLADAREQRDAACKELARGDDASEKIKLEGMVSSIAAPNSFADPTDRKGAYRSIL